MPQQNSKLFYYTLVTTPARAAAHSLPLPRVFTAWPLPTPLTTVLSTHTTHHPAACYSHCHHHTKRALMLTSTSLAQSVPGRNRHPRTQGTGSHPNYHNLPSQGFPATHSLPNPRERMNTWVSWAQTHLDCLATLHHVIKYLLVVRHTCWDAALPPPPPAGSTLTPPPCFGNPIPWPW